DMRKIFIATLSTLLMLGGCSDLDEKLNDATNSVEAGNVDVQQLLNGAYANLRDLQSQDNLFALTTHTSDEVAGPTRGRDWDDAARRRLLQTNSETNSRRHGRAVWNTLNRNSHNAQLVLCNGATGQVAAEATFLRAFNEFLILDLYGQIPRRECNENLL